MAVINNLSYVNRCLKEPILIHESTSEKVPRNLGLLLSTFDVKLTEIDHLVILGYTMMVESGFIPYHKINDYKEFKNSPMFDIKFLTAAQTLPKTWKDDQGIYGINFGLPSLADFKVCLTALSRGETVVFIVWLNNVKTPSWSLALECRNYVLNRQTEFMSHVFFNLKELSQQFKNKISLPIRNYLKQNGNVEVCDLLYLPLEMKVLICTYLNRRDILRMSETCKPLYKLSRSEIIFKKFNLCLIK